MAAGDIYKGTYSGWYCPGDNEFKTEAQLVDGHCPDHPYARAAVARGGELVLRALASTRNGWSSSIATDPSFCEPEHFRNEVLGWLREGLRDFSISRSGTDWGIEFPGDSDAPHLRLVRCSDQLHHRRRLSR